VPDKAPDKAINKEKRQYRLSRIRIGQMKKINFVAIISIVIFVCALLLGANTVFSVSKIETSYSLATTKAYADSKEVQENLEKKYVGKNLILLSLNKVTAEFDDYIYFTVTSIEKKYPDTLVLTVTERTEVYALEGEDGFYMTDGEGQFLRYATENQNRADGEGNFLLSGFKNTDGDFTADGNFAYAMTVCAVADQTLGGIRSSLVSLTVLSPTSDAADTEFVICSKEGVTIHIGAPSLLTEEKIAKGLEKYLSLSDGERTAGDIYVLDSHVSEGDISCYYAA
jgi:hypothetical protein